MKKQYEDLTEKKFCMLTAKYRVDDYIAPNGRHSVVWHCICDCGKECNVKAYSLISGRTKSCGCYQTANNTRTKVALMRSGSIAEKYPELLLEWHYEKNDKNPTEVPCGSDYKAWWVCKKCGNEYQTRVSHRINNHACPFCSNPPKKIKIGFNDLKTFCGSNNMIYLLKEWDYHNNAYPPEHYAPRANAVVNWLCPFGHSYKMRISNRTSKQSQCPICNNEQKTSFAEQAILYYLASVFDNVENRNCHIIGVELDIYIPTIKTAIEYDGHDWHKNTEKKEIIKNTLCKEKGIRLIRIREGDLPVYDDCICIARADYTKEESLIIVINQLFSILNVRYNDIDLNRDRTKIYEQYIFIRKNNSLATIYPDISKEWHPTKNGVLQPDSFSYSSNKIVWWLCPKGHEYKTSINKRSLGNQGCPVCSNKKIVLGVNDITSYCQKNNLQYILEDWDYSKNKELGISIDSYSVGSIIRVCWKCSVCGFEWQNSINNRVRKKHLCPNCMRRNWPRRRKVKNIDTGELFNSISDAAKSVGISSTAISNCCKGVGKTAKGFHWKYVDEE